MRTLVIDTASAAASVAITDDDRVLGEFIIRTERTHSQQLMPMAAALIETLGLQPSDLEAVAVCVGPGSFTGVRIGIGTAKGFAQPFNLPVYPFTSTRLLAAGMGVFEGIVVAAIDAKRGNVYYGIYERSAQETKTLSEGILPFETLWKDVLNRFSGQAVLWTGDGTKAVSDYNSDIRNTSGALMRLAPEHFNTARASNFVDIREAVATTYAAVDAEYVQKSQAERDRND